MATKAPAQRPRARTPGSMAERIDSLDVGQSVADAQRFPINTLETFNEIADAMKKMRATSGAYVARITDELDSRQFRVESGSFLTNDVTAIHCAVVITRVE
ncbi:MAG: hypothetical protein M3R16_03650 [Pseudomonadota bacterium]|nr:hypothetical protein [Pseudomonadota bacterium]